MIEPYNLSVNSNGLDMMLGSMLKNTFFYRDFSSSSNYNLFVDLVNSEPK